MSSDNHPPNDIQRPDLHDEDTMRQFITELKSAVEEGKDHGYGFNGEDEVRIDFFNSDEAVKSVVGLLIKWMILPNKK